MRCESIQRGVQKNLRIYKRVLHQFTFRDVVEEFDFANGAVIVYQGSGKKLICSAYFFREPLTLNRFSTKNFFILAPRTRLGSVVKVLVAVLPLEVRAAFSDRMAVRVEDPVLLGNDKQPAPYGVQGLAAVITLASHFFFRARVNHRR